MIKNTPKILFLTAIIVLLLVIFFFILDYFSLIKAEQYVNFLKKDVKIKQENKVWKLEIEKQKQILEKDKKLIEETKIKLEQKEKNLDNKLEELKQIQKGIFQREKEIEEQEKEKKNRETYIKILANKIANMPPESAVQIMEKWTDQDIIDVFMQMDKDAEEEGVPSITSFLLTLLPKERSSYLTNKWLKNSIRFSD